MPSACCAVGCTNRKTKDSSLVFYRIPSKQNLERRKKWVNAVGRKDWSEEQIDNARLCSMHFISGKFYNYKYDTNIYNML